MLRAGEPAFGTFMALGSALGAEQLAHVGFDWLVIDQEHGAIDGKATTEQLEHIATLVPSEWLAPMAAGSPEQCVAAIRNQLALGCDGVIMHGATPAELAPIVDAYGASVTR